MREDKRLYGGFDRLEDDYEPIRSFAQTCNHIRYAEFDAYALRKVSLFALREHFDFDALNETLDKIMQTLPAIKRIFSAPIIRLKDSDAVVPVESVRLINHRTIVHAASRSELWENITEEGLKPRKLLTVSHKDDYAIYENIGFAHAVDMILQLVGRNMRLLGDMLYAGRDMRFNLLDRENHPEYFLAIGKLHIGYLQDYEKYRMAAEQCLNKLIFIDRLIRSRLGSPVYRKCKARADRFTLKKTNIFRLHKDYHRIYLLLKWFSDAKIGEEDGANDGFAGTGEGYGLYCSMLSIFAMGHFNLSFREDQFIDFYDLSVDCTFKYWQVKLETVCIEGIAALRFTFFGDKRYRILLLPATDARKGRAALSIFRAQDAADEYLLADPYENGRDHVYLSLFDIESFRRVQQLLLRGLIACDRTHTTCPFCGKPLACGEGNASEAQALYECECCRTQILHLSCPESGELYFATKISRFSVASKRADTDRIPSGKDRLLYRRYLEAQHHFRNITEIGERGEIICPRCGQAHIERSL